MGFGRHRHVQLEINALVFAVMLAALILHQATAMWDVAYAAPRRHIAPTEQHVHSLLEMLPLMAVILVAVLNWPQFLAVFGLGGEPARWAPVWQADKLPVAYVALLLAAALLFDLLPYVEELRRGLKAGRRAAR